MKLQHVKITAVFVLMAIHTFASCTNDNFKGNAKIIDVVSKDFTLVLPTKQENFNQGQLGQYINQSFEQGQMAPLDIVIVIDNSGSMAEEQENLSTKIQPLLSKISQSNWQIAVTTTDGNDSSVKYIKKGDSNIESKFQSAIKRGTSGSGEEKPFYKAVQVLKSGNSWMRAGSTVAILIVSDEDNCMIDRNSYGCVGKDYLNAAYVTNYLSTIRQVGADARVYGIIGQPGTVCPTAEGLAVETNNLILSTGGRTGSICDSDYTQTLTQISDDVARILKTEINLSQTPDPTTLKVLVDGQYWTDYQLVGNIIKFTSPPGYGSQVSIVYRSPSSGQIAQEFITAEKILPNSMTIAVNGQQVAVANYIVDHTVNKVTFSQPPANNAQIVVNYKVDVRTYDIDLGIDAKVQAGSVKVLANGVPFTTFTYNDQTKKVTLIAPLPPDGSQIHIDYYQAK